MTDFLDGRRCVVRNQRRTFKAHETICAVSLLKDWREQVRRHLNIAHGKRFVYFACALLALGLLA
jgi:hypothetical protein